MELTRKPTGSFSFLACTLFSLNLFNLLAPSRDVPPQDYNIIPIYIDKSMLIKIIFLRSGITGKMSKKTARRDKECLEYKAINSFVQNWKFCSLLRTEGRSYN